MPRCVVVVGRDELLRGGRFRDGRFNLLSGKKERDFQPDDAPALERICAELYDEYKGYFATGVNEEPVVVGFRLE